MASGPRFAARAKMKGAWTSRDLCYFSFFRVAVKEVKKVTSIRKPFYALYIQIMVT